VQQGAFILAKAKGDAAIAAESIDHLPHYIRLLFNNGFKMPVIKSRVVLLT
jgi:TetR/AcrR family transcriptional repressor of nem operon